MKPIPALCGTLFAAAIIYAQDSSEIDQITKQRDALLAKIHDLTKRQFEAGEASREQLRGAALELYAFRRDSAKMPVERLQWQERIVAVERELSKSIDERVSKGTATSVEGLRATERLLAAEQKLLELKATK